MKEEYNEITITGLDDDEIEIEDTKDEYDLEERKLNGPIEGYELEEPKHYEEENEYNEDVILNRDMDAELKKELEKIIAQAIMVRENAHHNHYKVGAVLKMKSGKIYTGCNINNQDIMSICAERVAFSKAISEGEKDFEYILIVGGPVDGFLEKCLPCGYCRQFMSEFVNKSFKIYSYYNNKIDEYTIENLLPEAFEY